MLFHDVLGSGHILQAAAPLFRGIFLECFTGLARNAYTRHMENTKNHQLKKNIKYYWIIIFFAYVLQNVLHCITYCNTF
jgi:hypothetical protein